MELTRELEDLLPTEDDVASYEEHGYYVSGRVLDDELLDAALRGAERHWAGERDWVLPVSGGFADWRPGDGGVRNSEYTALQNREIRALVQAPVIGAIAARLSRSPRIRLWDDQLVGKPPASGGQRPVVGWHTDRSYWLTCTSESMLTAWIPFQHTPAELGPVIYIDGSHRWPDTDDMRGFNAAGLDAVEQRFTSSTGESLRRVMALERGQVAFHHSRTVHGSGPNVGDRIRISLALHLQDDANRYRPRVNADGVPWHMVNDDLARRQPDGSPDYTDPAVFPVLWSDDGSAAG